MARVYISVYSYYFVYLVLKEINTSDSYSIIYVFLVSLLLFILMKVIYNFFLFLATLQIIIFFCKDTRKNKEVYKFITYVIVAFF